VREIELGARDVQFPDAWPLRQPWQQPQRWRIGNRDFHPAVQGGQGKSLLL